MGGEHKETDRLIAVGRCGVPDGEEVAQRLGHLLVVDVEEAVVHPVMGKGGVVGRLRLGDLVLVVGELEILAAAVDVDGLAQVLPVHGGALDVPAGTALAPGGLPVGFAGLGGLPESKVQGIFLLIVHVNTGAGEKVLDGLMAQLAVALEL